MINKFRTTFAKIAIALAFSLLFYFFGFAPAYASGTIDIWWPTDTAELHGTQPFKGLLQGAYVNLYKMVDPTNSEAWYFSAVLHARSNDMAAVEADLLKAVEYGFNDKARMHSQNDFVNRGIDFGKIERGMK